jgi:cardiolipin synthase
VLLPGQGGIPLQRADALYDQLLVAGVEIYEYQASYMHESCRGGWEVGDRGFLNIDPFSLLLAREANLAVWDPDLPVVRASCWSR